MLTTTREFHTNCHLISYKVQKQLQSGPRAVVDAGESFMRVLKLPDWPTSTFLKLLSDHQWHQQSNSTKKKENQEFKLQEECPGVSLWMFTLLCCEKHETHWDLMEKHKWRSRIKDASFLSGMRGLSLSPPLPFGHRAMPSRSMPVPTACSSCRSTTALHLSG